MCVLATGLCTNAIAACTSQADDSYSGANSGITVETQAGAPVYQATPTAYRSACAQAGTIETFDYTAHDDNGNAYTKQCRVYLPYGYDSSKQYDVLYLMHGFYGNIRTILEGTVGGRKLQYVVDHLIADGRMRPMIIVTPTITDYYTTNNWIKFPKEVREDLIPAIEGKYSTYSRSTSAEDLIAARNHRAFSGFSMGGTTTWNMFQYNLAYFRTFIPISGTSWALGNEAGADVADATAELLKNSITEQGYGKDDFFIYAATGTNDVAYPLHTHIEAMQRLTDMFTYDYRPSNGNLCFLLAQGGRHDYDYVTDYLYVLLPHLFAAEGDATGIANIDATQQATTASLYSINGKKVDNVSQCNLSRGIYVAKNKKYIVK